jgi:hypothetical protein
VRGGTSLRHVGPARFRRGRTRATVEGLTRQVAALVAERQQLRTSGADAAALERNRLEIARVQWELGHALIERHLQQPTAQTAA